MNEFTNILNRLEKASPKSERTLVQEYFNELSQCCSNKDKDFLLDATSTLPKDMDLWAGITQILKELNKNPLKFDLAPTYLCEDLRDTLKTFSKIANRRATKIKRISTHIMNPRAERLCFRLSKISLKELAERLQQLWTKFRNKNLPQLTIPDENLGIKFLSTNTYILLNTIKNIHHALAVADPFTNLNDPWASEIPTIFFSIYDHVSSGRLNAFRFSLEFLEALTYVHHLEQTMPTPLTIIELFPFHDFVHCSKCWRLVPRFQDCDRSNDQGKKHQKNIHIFYCDEHSPIERKGHSLTEYHKAIKLPCNNKKEGSDPATAQKTFELMRHFPSIAPDHPDGLSALDWYKARVTPLHLLDLSKYPKIIFDLNWIWELCPNVSRYIQKKGGDPNSPESVLDILDPFTQKEEAEGKELRIKLHKLLAKNFSLYFQEIAMAETFLSEYNQQWDGRTHGGNRRGKK